MAICSGFRYGMPGSVLESTHESLLASAEDLPPFKTYNRGVLKSNPRSSRSLNSAPTTVAFSVAPSRSPNTVLRPSQPMPKLPSSADP